MNLSFKYLLSVGFEILIPFDNCFWVILGFFHFLSIYMQKFFYSRSNEFESIFPNLDAEYAVKVENVYQ